MVDAAIEQKISTYLNRLPIEQQHQVLEFARTLIVTPLQGVAGAELLQFAGTIDQSDLDAMTLAIHDGCERIDVDEW